MSVCIFCKDLPKVLENDLAYSILDINPVSKGHTLIIPKRHAATIFHITKDESIAIKELIVWTKRALDEKYNPDGYNIWMNCGKAAGQLVMHAHVHVVPRYKGEAINIREHLKGVDE